MKYIIYTRVSTDMQDVEMQESECRRLLKSLEPGEIQIFNDEDMSSGIAIEKRLGLQQSLNSLKKGNTLVVYKLDRISRDVVEMVSTYRDIKKKKCFILSVCEPNCDNEFNMGLMGVLAQQEKSNTITRIKSKARHMKSLDERVGTLPYGYSVHPEKMRTRKLRNGTTKTTPYLLISNPSEQITLNRMMELYNQELSFRKIAQILNEEGYRNRAGNPWMNTSVYRILVRTSSARSEGQLREDLTVV